MFFFSNLNGTFTEVSPFDTNIIIEIGSKMLSVFGTYTQKICAIENLLKKAKYTIRNKFLTFLAWFRCFIIGN